LTGRIGLFHLYPMILAELHSRELGKCWLEMKFKAKYSLREIKNYAETGGLPGICFLRNADERHASFESWIDTTCFRDLLQIKGRRLNGELAKEILVAIPTLEDPTAGEIARLLKKDLRVIKTHLDALALLFVVRPLNPHVQGVGTTRYVLFDSGLNHHLQGSLQNNLRIGLLNEIEAQFSYSGRPLPRITYYTTRNKSSVDLVIETREKKYLEYLLLIAQRRPHTPCARSLHFKKLFLAVMSFSWRPLTKSSNSLNQQRSFPGPQWDDWIRYRDSPVIFC
jgi:predicted AAA+ superfamily ATPase